MVKNRGVRRREKAKGGRHQDRPTQPQHEEEPARREQENIASVFRSEEQTELCRIWNVSDVSEVSPLVAAVALNKVALVKRLIADGCQVDSRGPGGRTALLEAVRMRSLELVDVVAALGADATLVDDEGNTAPLLALRDDWWTQDAMLALCGSLPKLDVDRAAGTGSGHTIMHHAVHRKWEALLEALLERHAQVDCVTRRGVSPLMLAGCASKWQLAERLLAAGACVTLEDVHGCTALCYACATLLAKGRNRGTVEVMLQHLGVSLEDYVQRRLHLLRHPPCGLVEFASPVSSIIAQALYCLSRQVSNGLRALLAAHVFAHVSRSIDAHLGCVVYVHALLGLLFDLARHCACCTQRAGVGASQLAAAFVAGGAPDICLDVLTTHCDAAQPRALPDNLMRLLVAAMLPMVVVFGRSPHVATDWLSHRGAELSPFYAVFRATTVISVSCRVDLPHLRLVRKQMRKFHAVYACASDGSVLAVPPSEIQFNVLGLPSLQSKTGFADTSQTSLESMATVTAGDNTYVESLENFKESSLLLLGVENLKTQNLSYFENKEQHAEAEAQLVLERKGTVEMNSHASANSTSTLKTNSHWVPGSLTNAAMTSELFLGSNLPMETKSQPSVGNIPIAEAKNKPSLEIKPNVTAETLLLDSKLPMETKSQPSLGNILIAEAKNKPSLEIKPYVTAETLLLDSKLPMETKSQPSSEALLGNKLTIEKKSKPSLKNKARISVNLPTSLNSNKSIKKTSCQTSLAIMNSSSQTPSGKNPKLETKSQPSLGSKANNPASLGSKLITKASSQTSVGSNEIMKTKSHTAFTDTLQARKSGCTSMVHLKSEQGSLDSLIRGSPSATSTPKSSGFFGTMSEKARRKDAEVLKAYRLLPRKLDHGEKGSQESGWGNGDSREDTHCGENQRSFTSILSGSQEHVLVDLLEDSGFRSSIDRTEKSQNLSLEDSTPLIVIFDQKESKTYGQSVISEEEKTSPSSVSGYQTDRSLNTQTVDEDSQARKLQEDNHLDKNPNLQENLDLPSLGQQGNASELKKTTELEIEIRQILSSLEDSILGYALSSQQDSGLGQSLGSANGSQCTKSTPLKKSRSRIQIRLSDRRRLNLVDDLFTSLVDALATRWHDEHDADYPGHRVLLSAGQDLTLTHLHRLLPTLERLHLARLARRWRALTRKLQTTDSPTSNALVGRLGVLLQSHLAALARGVPASLKRHTSWQDVALRKRLRVDGDETTQVWRDRVAEQTRAVRRRNYKHAMETRGARTQNLKVIVPRRTRAAHYNFKVIQPVENANSAGGMSPNCFRGTHYYQHRQVAPIAPPPGFGPQHFAQSYFDCQSPVHATDYRPTPKDFQYVHNAVNVQFAQISADCCFAKKVVECKTATSAVDFQSTQNVVDYLELDDDRDFEDFLQRKELACGARGVGHDDSCSAGGATEAETSLRLADNARALYEKWVPLRQPARSSVEQEVASLRSLRHGNLVVWETVTTSAAGLRIGCARMSCSLAQLVQMQDLDGERLHSLCLQMARGLRFLHSLAVVHGNLKPNNVLVDEGGVAKLADYGLHLFKPPRGVACLWWSSETRAQFVRHGQLVCSAESDVQVLGMLFHFAATGGRHPFVVAPGTSSHRSCASYELRQLTQDLLQHESSLRPSMCDALRHVCWWEVQDRRSLVLRCAAWLADGCPEQSVFLDAALEPLLPQWKARTTEVVPTGPETPAALLRMLHAAPQLTDALLGRLPELPLALHRLAAQTPSLRALARFATQSLYF